MGPEASCQPTLQTNISPRSLPQDTQLPSISTTDRPLQSSCRQRNRCTPTKDWQRIAESTHFSPLTNTRRGNISPVSEPTEKIVDKRLVLGIQQRQDVNSLSKIPASADGRQYLNSDNERRMIISDDISGDTSNGEAFWNTLSSVEEVALLRAEARAQRASTRNSKGNCWSLGCGAECNIEPAKPVTGQAMRQRNHLEDTSANFNHTPRRRRNARVGSCLLGFTSAKQIDADCFSVNEIDELFDRQELKPGERTGKDTEGKEQLDVSARVRKNAVCESTDTASSKRRQARINKKRFGVYNVKQEELQCSLKRV